MITLVRVDNRLIHGQVVEAWLPHLKVSRVVVADDEAASSPLIRAAMALAVQSAIEVQILPLSQVDFAALSKDGVRTLVLLRDVASVPFAYAHGLSLGELNLGNVHFGTGRRQVSPSVFLAEAELRTLQQLAEQGVRVEARAVPAEKPVELPDLSERWVKAG
ncbi:PTS sugar transporter subunit IIB [Myxococcus sp. MISCRS1]|uniref:PTS sugar transporter subunit IIBC n=1 Tax=Myxococcus fulvus TaxID=33 RepID=A0A511SYW8_MYXFU|nr:MULTISPECIES: PTS sugar transporter subunit IIB [Myxococcus]AKF83768.1 PTS sorbose transporter subunit IIC [Myxococcus fulvus 124B02]MBZ4396177.1 PTS sugar transporter subunit IIB [Myxococcus sp. AS-1-15]MBZ4408712.1 PTS sugar transporter subunit IIB [Myxococcus sp. XM-1-1-1]BDT37682.1 PTS sugar transporter subunit IIB [Myxococcus sp. MH1]MCK8498686.1 PTS sugar transporter subunit IIB [Myxococcus fulvus]